MWYVFMIIISVVVGNDWNIAEYRIEHFAVKQSLFTSFCLNVRDKSDWNECFVNGCKKPVKEQKCKYGEF